jgi:hypothetical protein
MPKRVFVRPERKKMPRSALILAIVIAALVSGVTGYAAAKLANGEFGPVQLLPE